MSPTAQRLLLSFIYIHREHIPLSALKEFVDALFTAASILPASGWIKMLLELLMIFCSARIKVCLGKRYEFDMGMKHELQNSESSVHYESSDVSKQTTDCASSDLISLKNTAKHHHSGSLLRKPHYQVSDFNDQQTEMEKQSDVPDMETEMSVKFTDADVMAATQEAKTDDSICILTKKQNGILLFHNVVLHYILNVIVLFYY